MGSSYSSTRSGENNDNVSQDGSDDLEVSSRSPEGAENNNVIIRDISPVESSEQDESSQEQSQRESVIEECTSAEDLFHDSRSGQDDLQAPANADAASPLNVPQAEIESAGDGPNNNTIESAPHSNVNREGNFATNDPHLLEGIAWQASEEVSPDSCLEDVTEATCSFISSQVTDAILGEEWNSDGQVLGEDGRLIEGYTADFSAATGISFPWSHSTSAIRDAAESGGEGGTPTLDFYPPVSQNYEWMGRSIETLLLGHRALAPVLALPEVKEDEEIESGNEGGEPIDSKDKCTRRTSVCSLDAIRSPHLVARRPSRGASFRRRRNSGASTPRENTSNAGPNVLLSLLAREGTGKPCSLESVPPTRRLREMGGSSLLNTVDKPAGGIVAEAALLEDALDRGDWTETQVIISRLVPRLVGDPTIARERSDIDDPSLPPSAPRFHAGGGRLGLEREAFVSSGGVRLLVRVFSEPAFVGDEIRQSNDARYLNDDMVTRKLSSCWNEVFVSLRELIYALPILVENGDVLGEGDFLPFLFTVLAHDHCFDGAASVIEEILSAQANSMQQVQLTPTTDGSTATSGGGGTREARTYIPPASSFFLGNVPDFYELLAGFNCRQLAHFCRLLVLLIFEPEDRQVLESPSVLKSVDLLQIRRDRATRAGRDATVDMNQAIVIGDDRLIERLLMLMRVMNFAPPLTNGVPYHIMAYFPFIAGTLPMVGLDEIRDFREIDRLEPLARTLLSEGDDTRLSDLGGVAGMLESLSDSLRSDSLEPTSQIGHILNVISAATQAGVVVGMPSNRGASNSERTELASAAATLTNPALLQSLQSHAVTTVVAQGTGSPQTRINTPEDAANELQLNAFILAPYQVEVLFVLCTLLGGRRKLDAQSSLQKRGLISILDDLFERLSFRRSDQDSSPSSQDEPHGIHGPGCECTPESAMSVQFLRLLHNFCDRDCDNHTDRRLLLSAAEREFVFSGDDLLAANPNLQPGLLSKVIRTFMSEADDSPYRFWLASCVESYLRGSCIQEQLFVAQSGLLLNLLGHVTSERIHCAGSLQTSFDLLGEICKGNIQLLRLLLSKLDGDSFQTLMSVATSNLVDSNVFIRSLILSIERDSMSQAADVDAGPSTRFYLTQSWWDLAHSDCDGVVEGEQQCDDSRPTDWFPPFRQSLTSEIVPCSSSDPPARITSSRQWYFPSFPSSGYAQDTAILESFLDVNRSRLLWDLLQVVDLSSINHENICCLNTAIVLMLFARRRGELVDLVECFKGMVDQGGADDSFVESMQSVTISPERGSTALATKARIIARFRELLWFWNEYYSHRGRDRISIEFSSHLHFNEWRSVVSILSSDGSSDASLARKPLRLPRSPYQRAPRVIDVIDSHTRGT